MPRIKVLQCFAAAEPESGRVWGFVVLAGFSPCKLCANRGREMGSQGQLAATHSPRLSSPIIFVGKFYLFNLLHIMHRLINYCFSAGRTRVYRAI